MPGICKGVTEQMKHFETKEKHAHKLAQAHQHDMMQSYDAGKRAAEWFHRPAYDVKNIKKSSFGAISAGGTEQIINVNNNTKNP